MATRWFRRLPLPLMLVLAGYAALAAAVQVHCADWLTSDGESYLRMANYYAKGDLRHAIFGVWSPLGAWLATPLVVAGMAPLVAFRVMLGLWGGAAVVATWRLAGRFGLGTAARTGATLCAALVAAQFSAEHRVDLLTAAVLLFYLDATMDARLLSSRRWAFAAGALGAVGYLAKFYALAFFLVHFPLMLAARCWMQRSSPRQALRVWAIGMGGFAVVAAPWVTALSVRLGRPSLGTLAGEAYAILGPTSGSTRREAITGLRRPPADVYNVWQDADQYGQRVTKAPPSPFSSRENLARQAQAIGHNAARIVGHLAAMDLFHLGLVAVVLTPLALAATWRRREAAFRYAAALLTLLVYCGGYAVVYAEEVRYFSFVFLIAVVLAFHFAERVPAALGWLAVRSRPRQRRMVAAAAGVMIVLSVVVQAGGDLRALLLGPPPGRDHRLVAERLRAMGVGGPLAATGPRGWWDGLHVAYFLDAKYAGTPAASDPKGIVAEMRGAGAAALLVWGDPPTAAALRTQDALDPLGAIPVQDGEVALFRLK